MSINNSTMNDYQKNLADIKRLIEWAQLNHESEVSDIIQACDFYGIDFEDYCTLQTCEELADGEPVTYYDGKELDDVCDAIREHITDDTLGHDTRTFIEVNLELNTPTTYIRFPVCGEPGNWEIAGNATYHSNHNESGKMQVIDLFENETAMLFELYNVAMRM